MIGWGTNDYGQLNIPADLTNVIGIAGGYYHSLALKADGTVVAWGHNEYGQTNVPAGLTNVIDIKGGYWHSSALKADGTVTNWGYGGFFLSPIPSDATNVVAIGAPCHSGVVLRSNGTIRVWGGLTVAHHNAPLTNAVAASLGGFHGMALRADGSLVGWGENLWGQTNVPATVTNTIAVASALNTVAALKRDGSVRTWGFDLYGATNLPSGLSNVVALSAGDRHFVFVRAGPAVPSIITAPQSTRRFVGGAVTFSVTVYSPIPVTYQWQLNGTNIAGATSATLTLSDLQSTNAGSYTVIVSNSVGSITTSAAVLTVTAEPIILSQPSDMRVLDGGVSVGAVSNVVFSLTLSNAVGVTNFWQFNGATVFISPDTNLYLTASAATHGTWSVICSNQVGATVSDPWNLHVVLKGQASDWGDSGFGHNDAPYPLTNLVAIAAGAHHSLGLTEDGTVIGWGIAMHGETNSPSGLSDVIAIGAGWSHSIALKANGTVVSWGGNSFEQTNVPVGLTTVKAIAAGHYHNLALKTNGTVIGWGYNGYGQTNLPADLTNIIAISAGWQHNLALRSNGTICAWGANTSGQCDAPSGLSNVVAISAGMWHNLALRSDGTVVGWGANTYGETNPPSGLSNVLAIAAGGQFSLALKNDGTVVAWGKSTFGVTNVPAPLGDVYAISAGFSHGLALTYSPVLNYIIDPSRDLLLVCNTNCADSVAVMNYYRTNRPMVASANVLGIGGATNAIERYADFDRYETTNTLVTPVLNWLTNNPTKRPNYIILFYGVPATACHSSLFCVVPVGGPPSSSFILSLTYPIRRPFVTHINMRTPQDCFAYVDKLVNFGSNFSPGRVYISASAGGYGGTNYFFDDIRGPSEVLADQLFPGACGSNGVIHFGASTNQIGYAACTNLQDPICFNTHLSNCTNVLGYLSWGYHGGLVTGFPTNGWVRFYGSSGWYLIQTVESFNGQWIPQDSQTTFHDYFTSSSFWGTNYSHTPVGTVSHTAEPGFAGGPCPGPYGGVASPFYFFGYWHAKKCFAICAWTARGTDSFQAVGDPFVTR